jgi:hypothetical protein
LREKLQGKEDFTVEPPPEMSTTTTTVATTTTMSTTATATATAAATATVLKDLCNVVVVMQLNVCRCWISTESGSERIVALARADEGPNGWLSLLGQLDLQGSQKKADSLFRLMFKAAQHFTQGFSSLDLKQVGLHFFSKTELSSITTFCEHALRCGVQFEKVTESSLPLGKKE